MGGMFNLSCPPEVESMWNEIDFGRPEPPVHDKLRRSIDVARTAPENVVEFASVCARLPSRIVVHEVHEVAQWQRIVDLGRVFGLLGTWKIAGLHQTSLATSP
jgi:hypothetical protein